MAALPLVTGAHLSHGPAPVPPNSLTPKFSVQIQVFFHMSHKSHSHEAIFQSDLNFHLQSEILPAESSTNEMGFQEIQSV